MRGRDLDRPFRGVRSRAPATDARARALAFVQAAGDRHNFSHVTAAQLYGFPLPPRIARTEDLHVVVPSPARSSRMRGVVAHHSRADLQRRYLDGLHVVGPLVAWVQLAAMLGRDDLVVIGDYLVAEPLPLVTIDDLATAADRSVGGRGARALREAAGLVRERVESPMETLLRLVIVDAGLPEPVVNESFFHEGRFLGRVDLAYPELKIAIEYQGDHHRTDRAQWQADIRRRQRFEDAGWRVIEVTSADLTSAVTELIARIRTAIQHRAARG